MKLTAGIYPVVPTPLTPQGDIDFNGFAALLDVYLASPVDGMTLLGSGGELPYFTDDEQQSIITFAAKQVNGRKPIIVGLCGYSAEALLRKLRGIQAYCDAVMLLVMPYYRLTFNALSAIVQRVAQQADIPVLYYHFPQISRVPLSAEQLIHLLTLDNVVGMKDSALHLPSAKNVLRKSKHSLYFSGLSLMQKPLFAATKHLHLGAICPLATLAPVEATEFRAQILSQSHSYAEEATLTALLPIVGQLTMHATWQYRLLAILSRLPWPMRSRLTSAHHASKIALQCLGVPITAVTRSHDMGREVNADAHQHIVARVESCLSQANITSF